MSIAPASMGRNLGQGAPPRAGEHVRTLNLGQEAPIRSDQGRVPWAVNDVTRWDEKAGLRRDAVRSQVIDVLEAQEIKETGNEEG